MTSKPGQQIITIHILPNISRSKDNQAMKFGQVIEYNKRNISHEKSSRRWGRESSSRPLFLIVLPMRQKQVVCSLISIYVDSSQPRSQ